MPDTNDVCTKTKDGQLMFFSPVGEKIRTKFIWNEDRSGLVEHEKIDVVKEMNERAKGMSIPEQIARLDRGDLSVIDNSRVTPDDYTCDVSGMPEHPIEIVDQVVKAKAAIQDLKAKDEENQMLKALQEDLIAKKKAYDDAMKAVDEAKANKDVKKDGE